MKSTILIYPDILRTIKTVEQAKDFSSEIDKLLDSLFKTQQSFEEVAKESVTSKTNEIIQKTIKGKNISTTDHEAVEGFLNDVKKEIQKLKVLKICLAFSPTDEIIEDIFNWVCENIGEGIILEIEKDESIIGGAIIVFNGKYLDFSVRKSVEEIFSKNKDTKAFSLTNAALN